MKRHPFVRSLLGPALGLTVALAAGWTAAAQSPLAIDSGKVTITGSSNVHAWTASTTKSTRGRRRPPSCA
jgi:hypothetical protein